MTKQNTSENSLSVNNEEPSSGGSSQETLTEIRQNAAQHILMHKTEW